MIWVGILIFTPFTSHNTTRFSFGQALSCPPYFQSEISKTSPFRHQLLTLTPGRTCKNFSRNSTLFFWIFLANQLSFWKIIMPNWCLNTLRINGNREYINQLPWIQSDRFSSFSYYFNSLFTQNPSL